MSIKKLTQIAKIEILVYMDFTCPKVSVIIAVYKVEKYIERCLHSLFGQTLDYLEYIFVDDASPDSSMRIVERILEEYPHRKSQVNIIRHSKNKGIAGTRKDGILAATGEYIIHCDPDDYVDLEMYEELYNEAKRKDADIVVCDYYKEKENSHLLCAIKYENSAKKILAKMSKGGHFAGGPLWNFLTRRSIIITNKILPIPHADFEEDSLCRIITLYYSDRVSYINKPFYHYCVRADSLTAGRNSMVSQQFQFYDQNIQSLIKFFEDKEDFQNLVNLLKLRIKFLARHLYREKDEKGWFNLNKEAHIAIFSCREIPRIQRIFWAFSFSNYLVYKMGLALYTKIKGKPF